MYIKEKDLKKILLLSLEKESIENNTFARVKTSTSILKGNQLMNLAVTMTRALVYTQNNTCVSLHETDNIHLVAVIIRTQ